MEAVIAAIFLDGGLAAVHRLVDPFLEEAYARASSGSLDRDFKTQLQELAQARHRSSPRYRVVAELGPDHSKTFEVEVELRGEVLGRGAGRSKKDAEQGAARMAVEALAARPAEAVEPSAVAAPPEAIPLAAPAPEPVPEAAPDAAAAPRPPRKAGKARKPSKTPARRKPAARKTPRKAGASRERKIATKRVRD